MKARDKAPARSHRVRQLGGAALTATSAGLLWIVASPWREIGGLVGERLRWLLGFVLCSGAVVGFYLARVVLDLGPRDRPPRLSRMAAALLYPAGAATALLLVVLRSTGPRDAIGVVTTAFLSYGAGVSFALVGLPLLRGRTPDEPDPEAVAPRGKGLDATGRAPSEWSE